jgi:hypothetical protein
MLVEKRERIARELTIQGSIIRQPQTQISVGVRWLALKMFWLADCPIDIMLREGSVSVFPLESSRPERSRSSCRLLVVSFAIFALTASVATRTSVLTDSHGASVQSVSVQAMRQHLDGDAVRWVGPALLLTVLEAPSFYPRVAPAGPPLSSLVFDESLYNRPPPSC